MFEDYILVSSTNDNKYPETHTNTKIAQYINSYTDKDLNETRFEIAVLTDNTGKTLEIPYRMVDVKGFSVVSTRPIKSIVNKSIYYLYGNSNKIIASGFTPIDSKSSTSLSDNKNYLGSGIYGFYFDNELDFINVVNKVNSETKYVSLKINNPFVVQDQEHYDSIINFSKQINNFVDIFKLSVIKSDREDIRRQDIIFRIKLQLDLVHGLFILFIIILKRVGESISFENFYKVLILYLVDYTSYKSNISDENIMTQPINYFIQFMEHDSLVGDASYMPSMTMDVSNAEEFSS